MRSDRLCPLLTMKLLQFYYSRFTARSRIGADVQEILMKTPKRRGSFSGGRPRK